jgi:hypothetical protein
MNPSPVTRMSMRANQQTVPGLEAEKYPSLKNTLLIKPILYNIDD